MVVSYGLNVLSESLVAVAMSDCVEVCSHCRHSFTFRADAIIGFYAHWDGDYYLIDVVLFVEGSRLSVRLYGEVVLLT